jgi:hypothetical protein
MIFLQSFIYLYDSNISFTRATRHKFVVSVHFVACLSGSCVHGKGKVVPVLNGFKHCAMTVYGGVDV